VAPKVRVAGAAWVRDVWRSIITSAGRRADRADAQLGFWGMVKKTPLVSWLCRRAVRGVDRRDIRVFEHISATATVFCVTTRPLRPDRADRFHLHATKEFFHVSPFQPVEGGYSFGFDFAMIISGVWIDYTPDHWRLIATPKHGTRHPADEPRNRVVAALRRPVSGAAWCLRANPLAGAKTLVEGRPAIARAPNRGE